MNEGKNERTKGRGAEMVRKRLVYHVPFLSTDQTLPKLGDVR
jgi:hypothetical protein